MCLKKNFERKKKNNFKKFLYRVNLYTRGKIWSLSF